MTIYYTPSLPPCRVNSWNYLSALNSWTQNCLFLRFRRLSEQIRVNVKTIIMVISVILIHGLSLTLHVYEFLCFFYMDLYSLRNKLICINWNVFISSSLEFLIAVKERQFILLQTKIWGFFWLDIFFKKFCFLTNIYGRPASTETTSLVINAYFIGFD